MPMRMKLTVAAMLLGGATCLVVPDTARKHATSTDLTF